MEKSAREKLMEASQAVATAAVVLKLHKPTMEAFLKEARDMDNFGHIVDPTLWKDPERRAVSALVKPLFEAAITFLAAHDAQLSRSREALEKVRG